MSLLYFPAQSSGSGGGGGAWTLISSSEITTSTSTVEFTSGIDSTYEVYCWFFSGIKASANAYFQFAPSTNGGSSYELTTTSTLYAAYNQVSGAGTGQGLSYDYNQDLKNASGPIRLSGDTGTTAENARAGQFFLYNPSSTSALKMFEFRCPHLADDDDPTYGWWGCSAWYGAGFFPSADAVDAAQFNFSTGTIEAGRISLFGIKHS